jgi:cell division protein FtsL
MVPVSLGRTSAVGSNRREVRSSLAWFRPANIAADTSADVRALVVWLSLVVTLGVAIGLVYVWLRLKVRDLGYELSATRQVIERLQQEEHELNVEAASLDAPARLEQLARVRLGMTRPEKGQEAVLP